MTRWANVQHLHLHLLYLKTRKREHTLRWTGIDAVSQQYYRRKHISFLITGGKRVAIQKISTQQTKHQLVKKKSSSPSLTLLSFAPAYRMHFPTEVIPNVKLRTSRSVCHAKTWRFIPSFKPHQSLWSAKTATATDPLWCPSSKKNPASITGLSARFEK